MFSREPLASAIAGPASASRPTVALAKGSRLNDFLTQLVMQTVLADVHHRVAIAENGAGRDFGHEQIVIAGREAIDDLAFEIGERLGQNRTARAAAANFHITKSIFLQREAAAEVDDHVRLPF